MMIPSDWSYYKEVNCHPLRKERLNAVESVLHSICCADGISWEDAFRRLIHCSAQTGTMPFDRRSIRRLLQESGFYLQAGSFANRPVLYIIRECDERFHDGEQVIVNLFSHPSRGAYLPILPAMRDGAPCYALEYPVNCQDRFASEVWIRWKDRRDHSIAPRKNAGRQAKKREMSARDHETLVAFNENPTDNLVGDCAVRALAGALEISWEEAVWKLAEAGRFLCTQINQRSNIENCLRKAGFECHGPICRDGRILTGKEFCDLIHDMFEAGTRLFAYSGRNHAVAILVFDGDYKIVDTWDSTGRPINGYWAKYPEQQKRTRPSEALLAGQREKLTELAVGTKVRHRVYGVGEVTAIADAIAVIQFANGVKKELAVDWVLANCKPG